MDNDIVKERMHELDFNDDKHIEFEEVFIFVFEFE